MSTWQHACPHSNRELATTDLAGEVDSVSLPPHVSLNGVPWDDRLRETGLDGFDPRDIISAVLAQHVARSDSVRAQAVENRCVKTCTTIQYHGTANLLFPFYLQFWQSLDLHAVGYNPRSIGKG